MQSLSPLMRPRARSFHFPIHLSGRNSDALSVLHLSVSNDICNWAQCQTLIISHRTPTLQRRLNFSTCARTRDEL